MLISVGELIKQGFAFAKENWQKYAVYVLALLAAAIPYGLFYYLMQYNIVIFGLLTFIAYIALLVFSILISVVILKNTKKLMDKQPIEALGPGLQNAKPLFWPLVVVGLLTALIVGVGSIIVIPGIIFLVWYAFGQYEVIFENQRGMAALRASKKLVQGRWWAVLWRIIGPMLPLLLVGVGVGIVAGIFGLISTTLGNLVGFIINIALVFLLAPYSVFVYMKLYQDLKAKSAGTVTPAAK